MVFNVTPFFRSPFTDLTQVVLNAQHYDKCGEFEMQMMECMEAYGAVQGKTKCADLTADFKECYLQTKQRNRSVEMRSERDRQYRAGERKEHYQQPGPRVDSY
jgi:NADH dehydrogenase (ubiquinone) Fe-S protein 5